MRQSFDKNVAELTQFMQAQKGNVISGAQTVKQALNTVGVFFVGKVKEIFVKGEFKENALFTKLKKNATAIGKAKRSASSLFRSIRANQRRQESKRGRKKYDFYSDNIKAHLQSREAAMVDKFKKNVDLIQTGGNTTPLIDTGRLRQSINHEVVLGRKAKGK